MRGFVVVGWGFLGAIVIGVFFAVQPWLAAGHVPTVDESISQPQNTAEQEDVGPACAYCRPLDELRNAFLRRVDDARQRIAVLKDSISNQEAAGEDEADKSGDLSLGTLKKDLVAGERNLSAAMAAVDRINGWRKHCQDDPICRPAQIGSVVSFSLQTRCGVMTDSVVVRIAEARKLASRVMAMGSDCESKKCPSSECAKGHDLRHALAQVSAALQMLTGPGVLPSTSQDLSEVRRSAEIRDVAEKTSEEIGYTSRLFPMMFNDSTETSAADILAMANDRLAARGATLSRVTSGPSPNSPAEAELSWWLRLLKLDVAALHSWSASDVADLRRDKAIVEHWGQLSDDLGSALLHAAKLDLALQPPATAEPGSTCDGSRKAADAAASTRAALAALSVCTRRSGCDDEELVVAAPIDAPAAVDLLQEGLREASAAIAEITVSESEQPQISLTNDSFDPGEAIQIRLEASRSQCLAGAGGILRMTKLLTNRSKAEPIVSLGGQSYVPAPQAAGNYKLTLESPASRGGVMLAATEFTIANPTADCDGFDGRWQTDFGSLNLKVRNYNVTGSYRRAVDDVPGIIIGIVSGTTLRGQWQSEDDSGGIQLTLDPGAKSFSGSWGRNVNEFSGGGNWTGQCNPAVDAEGSATPVLPY